MKTMKRKNEKEKRKEFFDIFKCKENLKVDWNKILKKKLNWM